MELKLEVVVIPVSDVERAKRFYVEGLGCRMDVDHSSQTYEGALGVTFPGRPHYRLVQLTPPGSACSLWIGEGVTEAAPGSYQGMHLVAYDIEATRAELAGRGVEVGEFFHYGPQGRTAGLDPQRTDYASYFDLSDPDGNGWIVQEIKHRLPGR
ncbi:Catechol 2,3-dioxygenase [Streptomyces sp. DvalAA-14]|uniref:VOC family protein n=1 Tax=unclassified Streptomyces TaxID=2593676 RepID=UPI00081B92C9|nr:MULTISPECIES: VOC family protein [unclassified Streptomyces]MYS18885.1 VOC family protein [Streptomyces sp. SID4948]SCD31157.1 Catechol 2,3-dioxygenase [Streptomyces sp. DvalAA-14]